VAFFISEPGIRRTEPSVVVAPPRTPHAWTLTVSSRLAGRREGAAGRHRPWQL